MTELRDTVPVSLAADASTLPMQCREGAERAHLAALHRGQMLGDYQLLGLMKQMRGSELWFARGPGGESCVAKFVEGPWEEETLEQLRMLSCDALAQLLDFGPWEGGHYEITPYYRGGCVMGPQSEETIRTQILPGLLRALTALHREGIIHNDIKPENLFWNERHDGVVLGDYGSAGPKGRIPTSLTPAYAAPELLLGNGGRCASDWCSVGLTLAAMAQGNPLVCCQSVREARGIWERGVRLRQGSAVFQQLVNGMLHPESRKRLGPKAAQKWCEQAPFGGEARKSVRTERRKQPLMLVFENPRLIAADIPSLLQGIEDHWAFGTFLFQEGRFDAFLAQFDWKWFGRCKELRRINDAEDGLFRLTMELMGHQGFLWRGVRYPELNALESEWSRGGTHREDVLTFLQRGLVGVCLDCCGADAQQLEYVRKLQSLSHFDPDGACRQLFRGLLGENGYTHAGVTMQSLSELAAWLSRRPETLDEDIDALMRDSSFQIWLSFQGMEGMLEQIERKTRL